VANNSNKNRPMWRIPLRTGPKEPQRFKGYQSRFGDGHPNRRQCVAIARSTGKQCRCDALQNAACCRLHGGHRHAARASGVDVTMATARRSRVALARVGAGNAPHDFPHDVPLPVSPVERGKAYEAWCNRALAPREWLAITVATYPDTTYVRDIAQPTVICLPMSSPNSLICLAILGCAVSCLRYV
jgi:hypothetical protein